MPKSSTDHDEFELYARGMSIPEVSAATGIPLSTLRFRFKGAGILRSRADGVRLAANKGLLGSGMRGKRRVFTDEWKERIRQSKIKVGRVSAKSTRINSNGYVEFTRGENKGKSIHVFLMEERIGRALLPDEVVHHIDGCKLNNSDNNLALTTVSGHSRLHRHEDKLSGKERLRNQDGTWN